MKPYTLLPDAEGLHLDYLDATGDRIVVHMSTSAPYARCPNCSNLSDRIHSRYSRTLADLPWAHCAVCIQIAARKFFCDDAHCKRRIFTEPLPQLAARYARKTKRLQDELYLIGYSLGGRAGAREANGLGREVSADTLLRQVRRRAVENSTAPAKVRILGVDDFAFRKGHHYGTLLIDLEQHRPIDLLPDREADSLSKWLLAHPGVEVVSRDRACAYSEAAATGAPDAMQVADRFHLLHNLVEAIQTLVSCHGASLRQAAKQVDAQTASTSQAEAGLPAGPTPDTVAPAKPLAPVRRLTRLQKQSIGRRERRLARYNEVIERHARGESFLSIAHALGISRNTVSNYVHTNGFPERAAPRQAERKIAPFVNHLRQRWQEGCHTISVLYREIKQQGYSGNYDGVHCYLKRVQLCVPDPNRTKAGSTFTVPSARSTVWLLLLEDKRQEAHKEAFIHKLCEICPEIARAQQLALEFFDMVNKRKAQDLDAWMGRVAQSQLPELQRFAKGLVRDKLALLAALTEPWSNGQTEGQVNRLKLVKRSMYGRANFDLLQARVLPLSLAA